MFPTPRKCDEILNGLKSACREFPEPIPPQQHQTLFSQLSRFRQNKLQPDTTSIMPQASIPRPKPQTDDPQRNENQSRAQTSQRICSGTRALPISRVLSICFKMLHHMTSLESSSSVAKRSSRAPTAALWVQRLPFLLHFFARTDDWVGREGRGRDVGCTMCI